MHVYRTHICGRLHSIYEWGWLSFVWCIALFIKWTTWTTEVAEEKLAFAVQKRMHFPSTQEPTMIFPSFCSKWLVILLAVSCVFTFNSQRNLVRLILWKRKNVYPIKSELHRSNDNTTFFCLKNVVADV